MKETWELIKKTVEVAPLTEAQKPKVLEALDYTIGENAVDNQFPIEQGDLNESEFIVYRDVLQALNEAQAIITNDREYEKAVEYVMKEKGKDMSTLMHKALMAMDDAYKNGNWRLVNKHYKSIKDML